MDTLCEPPRIVVTARSFSASQFAVYVTVEAYKVTLDSAQIYVGRSKTARLGCVRISRKIYATSHLLPRS